MLNEGNLHSRGHDGMSSAAAPQRRPRVSKERARRGSTRKPGMDPVAREGLEIARLSARFNELDAKWVSGTDQKQRYRSELDEIEDRLLLRRDSLSLMRATTLEGAAVQLREAMLIVDAGCTFEDGINDRERRQFMRLYYSALAVVKQLLGPAAVSAFGLDSDDYHNPWKRYADALPDATKKGRRGGKPAAA